MTAKQFITESLSNMASAFPYVTIKYAFNSVGETHIVELTPVKDYYNNTQLEAAWYDIAGSFMELYPLESIAFISNDSTLKIIEPEMQLNVIDEMTVALV